MDTTRLKRSSRPRPKSVNLLQSSSFQGSIPSSAQTPQESRNPRRRHGEFEWQLALLERSTDVTPMESKARPLAPLHDNEPEPVSLPEDNPTPRSKLSHARSGDFVWQLALLQDEGTGIATGKKIETTTTEPNLVGNTFRSAGLRRSRGDLDLKSKVDFQEAKSQASAGSDKKLARPGILGKQDRLSPLPDKSPVKSSAHQGRDQEYVWQSELLIAELAWATQPSPIPEGSPIPEHRQDRKAQAVKEEISAALGRHLSGNQARLISLEHRFQDGSYGASSLKMDLQNGAWEYPEFEGFQASLFHEQSQLLKSDSDSLSSPIVTVVDPRPEDKLLRRRASEDVVMLPSSSSRRRLPETLTKIEERPASIASLQFEHLQPSSVHTPAQLHKAHGDRPSSSFVTGEDHRPENKTPQRRVAEEVMLPSSSSSRPSFSFVTGADHRPEKKVLQSRVTEEVMLPSSSNSRPKPEEKRPFFVIIDTFEFFECGVCRENRYVTEKLTIADCAHFFCKECLTMFAKTKIDEAQYPIPCPECLAEKRNDNFLTQDIIDKLNLGSRELQRLEGLQLAAHSVTIKCPRCKESMHVDREQYMGKTIIICPAPRCEHQWCKTCLETFAEPYSAQMHRCEAPLEFDELMQKEGWKYCPGCRTPVQRSSGCHHMTCITPGCKVHFCYDCGGLLTRGGDITLAISQHSCPPRPAPPPPPPTVRNCDNCGGLLVDGHRCPPRGRAERRKSCTIQ